MNEHRLSTLPIGTPAKVQNHSAKGDLRRRLFDMGLTPACPVTCLYESPFGDPRAYYIRGATIALREEEAKQVTVITE